MTVTVNGKPLTGRIRKKSYHSISVVGDAEIVLRFESKIVAHERAGRVYFTKGALTYCLAMEGERQTEIPEGKSFPKYRMYADREWRYAIKRGEVEFTPCEGFEGFVLGTPLPSLTVKAVKIQNYDFERVKRFFFRGDVKRGRNHYVNEPRIFTPRLLSNERLELGEEVEVLRLYPYGAGKLRVTVFNYVN
jgi:hypothetical protein